MAKPQTTIRYGFGTAGGYIIHVVRIFELDGKVVRMGTKCGAEKRSKSGEIRLLDWAYGKTCLRC